MDASRRKMISDIVRNWELDSHGIDPMVMEDIESALFESYMNGCCAGGMDSDEFKRGLQFCQEIENLDKSKE